MTKRIIVAVAMLCIVASSMIAGMKPASAQSFPERTVRIIVPTPPGGSIDMMSRVIASKLSEKWAHPVIIENRPGAAMRIGVGAAAKAEPDGHTLLVAHDGAMAVNPALFFDLPYDSQKSFDPVSMLVSIPLVILASDRLPVKSVKELIDYAKANPGKLNHATGGPGGFLGLELFNSMAGTHIVNVQYSGAPPSVNAVISGEVELCFTDIAAALPALKSSRVRTLAVTSSKRTKAYPDLPTASESGLPGYEGGVWMGMFIPAGTPPKVRHLIETGVRDALAMPDVRDQFERIGMQMRSGTSEELASALSADIEKWRKLVKERNLKYGK